MGKIKRGERKSLHNMTGRGRREFGEREAVLV